MNDILRAVIFDMDGVIVDSQPYHFAVEEKIFKELGFAVTQEESHSFVGMAGDRMWACVKEKYGLRMSMEELMAFDNRRRIEYFSSLENVQPIPGVAKLLQQLKQDNIKTALASSSSVEVIEIFISKLGIGNYFGEIISGDSIQHGKPAPDIFIHAAKVLSENVSSCIVIEDSTNGVKAAKLAGMKCVGFQNPNSGDQDLSLADMVIDNFRKVNLEIFESLYH